MKKNTLPSPFTDGNRTNRNTQSRADLDSLQGELDAGHR